MNDRTRKTARALFSATAIAAFAVGCAWGPKVETTEYKTDTGAIIVESVHLEATVTAVDEQSRSVTIDPKHADPQTVQASADAANFSQIQVGDTVAVEIIEETIIALIPGGAAESVGELDAVALSPLGDKPALLAVSSTEVTADIIAIDAHSHTVTLEFIDGTVETTKVGKHIDLTLFTLNDSVRIQVTDAVAIAFEPKKD